MAISSDYPRPIVVNGYQCRNCDDVSDAKRNIDPATSKLGTAEAPTGDTTGFSANGFVFGGTLAERGPAGDPRPESVPAARLVDRFA